MKLNYFQEIISANHFSTWFLQIISAPMHNFKDGLNWWNSTWALYSRSIKFGRNQHPLLQMLHHENIYARSYNWLKCRRLWILVNPIEHNSWKVSVIRLWREFKFKKFLIKFWMFFWYLQCPCLWCNSTVHQGCL